MMKTLMAGDVAVVTGAARGIGRTVALGLAAVGARVAICDIDGEGGAETVRTIVEAGGQAWSARLDITDLTACKAFAADARAVLGPISVLINTAGVLTSEPLGSTGFPAAWAAAYAVNVEGGVNMVTAVLDQLRETRGRIVNFSSTSGFLASRQSAIYASTKGAINQLTRAMAVELGPEGIRVNAVAPGNTDTGIGARLGKVANPPQVYMRRTPLQKLGVPQDMVGPVIFLASHMSDHVTGVIIPVDGGYLATGIMHAD